jgi:CubicO group peptidase (beta-lactamase class C family)
MGDLWERTAAGALAAAVVLAAAGCSDVETHPETGGCDEDIADALAHWGSAGFSGAVVIDAPGEAEDCRLGVGRLVPGRDRAITADSVFAIGSVSKAFTAAAVLQLAGEGALDLGEPAGRYVAGLGGPAAGASVESLLLHTSGLVGSHGEDLSSLDRDQAVAALSRLTVDPAAQGQFLYSNAGYTQLALVVEGASGTDYRDYLEEQVLPEGAGFWNGEPAPRGDRVESEGSIDQGDFTGPHWALQGNGDLAMSADILAGWTRDLFSGDIVAAAELDLVAEPSLDDEETGQGITAGWAVLDAETFGEPVLATAGGGGDAGQNVVAAWLPESERTVVVASSSEAVTAEDLLQAIGPAIVAGDPLPRPDADGSGEVDQATLDAAAGTYVLSSGDGELEVTAEDSHLVVVPTGPAAFAALGLAGDTPPGEVADHEQAVEDLLAGRTQAGAEEVGLLEEEYGPLSKVEVLGSTVEDGELRTYVELEFAGETATATGWYALNSSGGIDGVDLSGPPVVELVATAAGQAFRPEVAGQQPGGDAVTVSFDADTMTIDGPDGVTHAPRRA